MRTRLLIVDRKHRTAATLLCVMMLCAALPLHAQKVAPKSAAQGKPATGEQVVADQHKLPAERGDVVDRIVAIVNGDLVLESDVEEEERFRKLYPYGDDATKTVREQAVTSLIDRTLLLQQEAGFPQVAVTDEQVKKDEDDLRKDLPACGSADCVSDAGWKKFLTAAGFTEDELSDRLRQRIQVLRFVEQRFRAGIRVSDDEIEAFYNKTLLPEYAKNNKPAPPLESISSRIEEILLQQQVSSLLDQWLKSLRDAGHVRVLNPTEEAP
jgi:peptidyl-prolyl cis-trans isomerase SurA